MHTLSHVNIWSVLVGTLAYFLLGSLWFSKIMFAKPWMEAIKIKPGEVDKSRLPRMMMVTLLCTFIICVAMDMLVILTGSTSVNSGIFLGLITGLGLVVTTQTINGQFENRSVALLLINGGYHLSGCIIVGIIEALWKSM